MKVHFAFVIDHLRQNIPLPLRSTSSAKRIRWVGLLPRAKHLKVLMTISHPNLLNLFNPGDTVLGVSGSEETR